MFDAMERGDLRAVYCIGENPAPWRVIAGMKSELIEIPRSEIQRHPVLLWKVLESYQRRLRAIEFRQARNLANPVAT